MEKYAPFLYLEQYDDAWMIIRNYLCTWRIPELLWEDKNEIVSFAKTERDAETLMKFYSCAKLALNENREECLAYLNQNLKRNMNVLYGRKEMENK